ncbi:methyltransferase, partial [Streptomyces varsoviensis]
MEAFTDRWADHFSKLYADLPLGEISWFTASVSPVLTELVIDGTLRPGQRVVDLGCGAGVHAAFLARHGMDVIGVDRSAMA